MGIALGDNGVLLIGEAGEGLGRVDWEPLNVKDAVLDPINEVADITSRASAGHRERCKALSSASIRFNVQVNTEDDQFLALAAARASGGLIGACFCTGPVFEADTWYYSADWIVEDFVLSQPQGAEQVIAVTLREAKFKEEGGGT